MGEIGNLDFKTEIWIWVEYLKLKFENKAENDKRKNANACMGRFFLAGPSPPLVPRGLASTFLCPAALHRQLGSLGPLFHRHAGPTARVLARAQ
jgi:hypothetical protein